MRYATHLARILFISGICGWQSGCRPAPSGQEIPPVISTELVRRSAVPSPDAQACAACHPGEVEAWRNSQHAHANRLVTANMDDPAFRTSRNLRHGSFTSQFSQHNGQPRITQTGPDGQPTHHVPEAVIGLTPLRQYLVPFPGGRLQVVDAAFDPRSNEWFNVFGTENRLPHEWGFWKNRGLNWNTQCAFCHMTGFQKNYHPDTDTYTSTWQAMGISCAQCHPLREPATVHSNQCLVRPLDHLTQNVTNLYVENCATCHSRREQLTDTYQPGDSFHDHFRLTLADQAATFYPDGQIRDEVFEYNSFLLSRMGHKGISCLDCHDPHSYQLKLPVQGNALCLSCHLAPGQKNAIVIDPATHSHHALTNAGSSCVECHMSTTTYMQRDPRRDHGFTSPDPQLTKELGIPNACNKCHTDKSVDWSIDAVQQWYGDRMEKRPARQRARLIARAQANDATVVPALLALTKTEEIIAWRATLLTLLRPWIEQDEVRAEFRAALSHPHPLLRSVAVNALHGTAEAYPLLIPLRRDPSRLVRLDAAWATLNPLENEPVSYRELSAYLDTICDQPAGALRQGQRALAEQQPARAESWMRKALAWDPSAVPHYLLGRVLHQLGKTGEAEALFRKAAELDPANAEYPYTLALLYGELNQPQRTLEELKKAVDVDPDFGRAWYNLGLTYAAAERLEEAAPALRKAEALLPGNPDAPYALATVYARAGQLPAARAAAQRALVCDPRHQPAQQLLRRLPPEG